MPKPTEHSARLKDPGELRRFRRQNDKFGAGIHAIWGIVGERTVLQAVRFSASKFSAAKARKWLKDHGYKPIKFEAASGKAPRSTALRDAASPPEKPEFTTDAPSNQEEVMGFKNLNEAKAAGAPTMLDGVALTLEQVNFFVALREKLAAKNTPRANAAAIVQFRSLFKRGPSGWTAKPSAKRQTPTAAQRAEALKPPEQGFSAEDATVDELLAHALEEQQERDEGEEKPPAKEKETPPDGETGADGEPSAEEGGDKKPDGDEEEKPEGKEESLDHAAAGEPEYVDIHDVEAFAPGEWNGRTFTDEQVSGIVRDTNRLVEVLKPFAKLGHDDGQKLLQSDGYPAAGWLYNIRLKGEKLVTDIRDVPAGLAKLLKAQRWRRQSVELLPNFKHGGKTYPYVLKALAFLGADLPAVTSLSDVVATYDQEQEVETYDYVTGDEAPPPEVLKMQDRISLLEDANRQLRSEKSRQEAESFTEQLVAGRKIRSGDKERVEELLFRLGQEEALKMSDGQKTVSDALREFCEGLPEMFAGGEQGALTPEALMGEEEEKKQKREDMTSNLAAEVNKERQVN